MTNITLDSDSDTSTLPHSGDDHLGLQKLTWSASSVVPGYATASGSGPGFQDIESTSAGGNPDVVNISPMPTNLTICKAAESECSDEAFDDGLIDLSTGGADAPYSALSSFGQAGDTPFPFDPPTYGDESLSITSDVPTHFLYETGDYLTQKAAFTTLDLPTLTSFTLQSLSQKSESTNCVDGIVTCEIKSGYLALDTGDSELDGSLMTKTAESDPNEPGNITDLEFHRGFRASNFVWAFNKTGEASAVLATTGAISCPTGTSFTIPGQSGVTGLICNLQGDTVTEQVIEGVLDELDDLSSELDLTKPVADELAGIGFL